MLPFMVVLALAQDLRCENGEAEIVKAAVARAGAFDLAGAAERLQAAANGSCTAATLPAVYLRAWLDARDAYRFGGSPESLASVHAAIVQLNANQPAPAVAEIASFVLQAAAAASQSERDELSFMIEHAVQLESVRLAAGLNGAPIITAHEAAGDLWLQVHRFDDARRAYLRAVKQVGRTPRVRLGLARTARRLNDTPEACAQYRLLVDEWKVPGTEPPEVLEARDFLREPACQASVSPRP
jgi:hypothetical protein